VKLALALYKYFPFGGVQRDCLRIAQALSGRGHQVEILCIEWSGDRPDNIPVRLLKVRGLANHRRYRSFAEQVHGYCSREHVDGLVGFNKFSGLDVYFAADGCYMLKSVTKSWLYRYTLRYRYFMADEAAVFGPDSSAHILALGSREMENYKRAYSTLGGRFTLLPPGVAEDRKATAGSVRIRQECRAELGVSDQQKMLLLVGSGFKTKGLDRALLALQSLPGNQRDPPLLIVIGKDSFEPFRALASRLGVVEQLVFFPGRSDIPRFLQAADLLVHPAYYENSGVILLEALVAGLPVLATETCGYARYISDADAGRVLPEPFDQQQMNVALAEMLTGDDLARWRANGVAFGQSEDLFSLHDTAAEVIEQVVSRLGVNAE
jgi:UDP-glucose:(heptosyl)LPS alpha-1,3-glucosyltransferase